MSRVDIEQAAKSLYESLRDCVWFVTIGVTRSDHGAPELIVYVTRRHPDQKIRIKDSWEGYPVRVVVMGKPQPAAPHSP